MYKAAKRKHPQTGCMLAIDDCVVIWIVTSIITIITTRPNISIYISPPKSHEQNSCADAFYQVCSKDPQINSFDLQLQFFGPNEEHIGSLLFLKLTHQNTLKIQNFMLHQSTQVVLSINNWSNASVNLCKGEKIFPLRFYGYYYFAQPNLTGTEFAGLYIFTGLLT